MRVGPLARSRLRRREGLESETADEIVQDLIQTVRCVYLQGYLAAEFREFQVSNLGTDCRRMVGQWSGDCRVDLETHLVAGDLGEEFAA